MKKILFIAVASVVFLSAGFKSDDWYKYSSSSGHFSISFPGKPDISSEKQTNAAGDPFDVNYVTYSPDDSTVYMVGYIDMTSFYPADKTIKEMLENSRDGAVGTMNATSVNTLSINLEGNPYIEFTFTAPKISGKDRIYIINKFQYSLITIFSASQGVGLDADRFIGSFKHTY